MQKIQVVYDNLFQGSIWIKQGCNLSPLLANIYLSDLHEYLEQNHNFVPILSEESVTSITWADDLLILSLHRDGLQNCLDNLNSYTQNGVSKCLLKKLAVLFFPRDTPTMLHRTHFYLDKNSYSSKTSTSTWVWKS